MALVRSIFRFEPTGWRPVSALLRFLGVTLAFMAGNAVGGRGAAVLAGVGALYAGMASFGGVHQARLKRMVLATSAATVTTLIGCYVQPNDWLTIAAVTFGAFFLSLLAAAGPDAAQVAVQATAILVVLSGITTAHAQPWGNAALVLGGGLAQAAILMLFHPISPVAAERRAVEAVYFGLARFSRSGGKDGPLPDAAPHAAARDLLRDAFGYGSNKELEKLWSELELADAIRGNLSGLARVNAPETVWKTLADWFHESGEDIARGRPVERRSPALEVDDPDVLRWLRRIRGVIEAEEEGRLPVGVPSPRSWLVALRNIETVRSLALGHALRYAVAVGIATAGYRLLKVDHGYWAGIAVAFSLRPDFATTIVRGLGRIVGTAFGVAVATAYVAVFHPSMTGLTVGMLASVWVAFALQNATYVGFSTGLAFYVVVSVTLSGMPLRTVGMERLEATAAGSILALAVAVLWPQWEAGKVRTVLAVSFATQAEYATAVLERSNADVLANARFRARAARLEAERVVAAAGFEPRWSRRRHLDGAQSALARLAENAARILAVHMAVLDAPEDAPVEEMRRLAAEDRSVAADLMG